MPLDQQLTDWISRLEAIRAEIQAGPAGGYLPRISYGRQAIETAMAFLSMELRECLPPPPADKTP